MKVNGRKNWIRLEALGALALAAGAFACSDNNGGYYYNPYYDAYGYYYPTDIAYTYPGYVDAWGGYSGYAFKSTTSSASPGARLRALAAGASICGDQATITTERVPSPCGGDATVPSSASIVFDGCTLDDGGRLDGSFEIAATQTVSDTECDAETILDVSFTSTASNLSYTSAAGARVLVPSLTVAGAYTRELAGQPLSMTIDLEGSVERYDEGGRLSAQTSANGSQTLVPLSEGGGYRMDGTLSVQDTLNERSLEAVGTGITRTDACCHPTSGEISIERSTGESANWSFGPSCGDVLLDGASTELADCL